jgi:hypothetical protein
VRGADSGDSLALELAKKGYNLARNNCETFCGKLALIIRDPGAEETSPHLQGRRRRMEEIERDIEQEKERLDGNPLSSWNAPAATLFQMDQNRSGNMAQAVMVVGGFAGALFLGTALIWLNPAMN